MEHVIISSGRSFGTCGGVSGSARPFRTLPVEPTEKILKSTHLRFPTAPATMATRLVKNGHRGMRLISNVHALLFETISIQLQDSSQLWSVFKSGRDSLEGREHILGGLKHILVFLCCDGMDRFCGLGSNGVDSLLGLEKVFV